MLIALAILLALVVIASAIVWPLSVLIAAAVKVADDAADDRPEGDWLFVRFDFSDFSEPKITASDQSRRFPCDDRSRAGSERIVGAAPVSDLLHSPAISPEAQ